MRTRQDLSPAETSLASRLSVWVATGLGVGLVSLAPGTVGGLWGLLLVPPSRFVEPIGGQFALVAVLVLAAVPICGTASRALGGDGDPGAIALDEIVVLPIVFLGLPAPLGWRLLIAGFLLFRLFDILKIGLTRSAEKLPGGWGIVADDVVAAILACFSLRALLWVDRAAGWDWLAYGA